MKCSTFRRPIAAALLVAAVAAPTALADAGDQDGIVLRRDGSKAVQVVPVPEPVARTDGLDWGDAGIGAGAAVTALLLASAGTHVARRRRRVRRSPLSAAWDQ